MSEEEVKAIEELKEFINDNEVQNISIFTAKKILNLIEKQQKEIENSVSKDKVKELKEKVHKTLDANGITRAYQIFIDKDFDELLGE